MDSTRFLCKIQRVLHPGNPEWLDILLQLVQGGDDGVEVPQLHLHRGQHILNVIQIRAVNCLGGWLCSS
jgi:hypothetical protein